MTQRRLDKAQPPGEGGAKKREALLEELTTTLEREYGYSIIRDPTRTKRVGNARSSGEFFGLHLLQPTGTPFLVVGVGLPEDTSPAQDLLRVELVSTTTAGQGVAYDGFRRTVLRRRFDTGNCDIIPDLEPYKAVQVRPQGPLLPLNSGLENLFFELHSHIRDIDGLHPDEALDELSKILYTKLFDEEGHLADRVPLRRNNFGSTEEFAAAIRATYEAANAYDVRVFSMKIPQYARSRGVFNSPMRLSSPALVRVWTSLEDYSISTSSADVKGRAFQRVFVPAIRAGMGQYFTPEPVVRFVVDILAPRVSELVIDPFCGSAHFLSRSLQHVADHVDRSSKEFHEFAFGKLHGIEKSDRMVRIAMTDMRLNGDGHSNIRCTDALLDFANYPDLAPESFDVVVTNPPFGSVLEASALPQLGRFELGGQRRVPLEVLGLERCLQLMRPGGRLAIVLPDSIFSNPSAERIRQWVQTQAKVRAIVSLPIETFSPFGAGIKTSILFARKWQRGEEREQHYPVALVRIDEVGYDATGRPRAGDDFGEARGFVQSFLKEQGW